MTRRLTSFATAATAALLSGCAIVPPPAPYAYTGPAAAELTLQNRSPYAVQLTAHDDGARCTGGAPIDAKGTGPDGASRLAGRRSVTVAIPSGREWAVHLVSDGNGEVAQADVARKTWKRCSVVGSFVPVAGKRYQAVYDMQDGTCFFAVYGVDTGQDGKRVEVREPTERLRLPTVSSGAGGGICQ